MYLQNFYIILELTLLCALRSVYFIGLLEGEGETSDCILRSKATAEAIMAADRKGRTVVFKTLEEATLVEIKQQIEKEIEVGCLVVLQELKTGEYLAELKGKSEAEQIIENGFDLTSTHVDCHPPKGYYTNVSLMGLRAYIEDKEIVSVLEKYGEIRGPVTRLKYKSEHELAGLENGNRLVRIVLNQPSIPYSLKIDGEWCRVIHSGQKPYCSTCNEFGHNRRNCKETVCHKCKGKGHIAMDCRVGHDVNNEQHATRVAEDGQQQANESQRDQNNEVQGGESERQPPKAQDTLNMETDGNDNTEVQPNLKRPHPSSTDTNTDTDTDGFQVVKPRRSRVKPTPKLPPVSKTATEKDNGKTKQIKPPTIIIKKI